MPTPTWATDLSKTVALYPVRNTLNVQVTTKPTQRLPTTGEGNKAPAYHKTIGYDLPNIAMMTE